MSVADELHPVIHAGRVACITGAASGIGRAAAVEFAKWVLCSPAFFDAFTCSWLTVGCRLGLKIAIADVDEQGLEETGKRVAAIVGEANLIVSPTDVSKIEDVVRLRDRVYEAWGEVGVLMNNAGVGDKGTSWEGLDNWHKVFNVNVFGLVSSDST